MSHGRFQSFPSDVAKLGMHRMHREPYARTYTNGEEGAFAYCPMRA